MAKIQLVLALHSHQPVGNFDHVFEQAYDRCYRPLLDHLARHPQVRAALHFTGPLLEWFVEHRAAYLKDVRALADRSQVEILGGGFYEPMLSVLPDGDATGQIEMMREFCDANFGQSPEGLWLAERVWEPDLPRILSPAGVRYTFLDDAHFYAAGIAATRLFGHYVTEKAGYSVAVFPIDKGLRYLIPFKPVQDVLEDFAAAAALHARTAVPGAPPPLLTYGDDGEKFGLWPGTHGWVYEKGWLEEFLRALADRGDVVETVLPRDAVKSRPPAGLVYLPTASYDEMMEWALPAESIRRYHELKELLDGPEWERFRGFVRGGIWQGFFAKYPEANHLHKRMLHVSTRLQEAIAERGDLTENLARARDELYRGQCNCPYWHGLFGGLYLNYLRHAVNAALVRAENLVDAEMHPDDDFVEYQELDFDVDFADEMYVANARLATYVDPDGGGTLVELDYRPKAYNVAGVLARRDEAYHDALRRLGGGDGHGAGQPRSIHDTLRAKEPDLAGHLIHDGYRRALFVDRFHQPGLTLESLRAGSDGDAGDFVGRPYRVESSGVDEEGNVSARIVLARDGEVRRGDRRVPVRVRKTYRLPIDEPRVEVAYAVENLSGEPVELLFAPELNLTLLVGDAADRYYELASGERHRLRHRGVFKGVRELSLVDAWAGFKVRLTLDQEAEVWCYPVETVSQSEDGFERTYQGSCLLLRVPLLLASGESRCVAVALRFDDFAPGPSDRAES